MGVLRADSEVKPTMSEKKMVMLSYDSGCTDLPCFSWVATDLPNTRHMTHINH
jgi:hypothetical protein